MVTLGDLLRRYGPAYRAQEGSRLSAEQRQVMHALEQCRTEALGGHVYRCPACATTRYSYHSCRNRHCPQCQQDATQAWLTHQQALLLPVPYFLVTFTLPAGLRPLARRQPCLIYRLLFRASAAALQQLAQDPRFIGGQIGMIGVLQTWTRDLRYHPHVHYLVPAIGLARDGATWKVGDSSFLVHAKPLAVLFRAKLRATLRQTPHYGEVCAETWTQPWVVDCRSVGSGAAALKYLAPYIFRVALSNNRIERLADDQVTFRYTERTSGQVKRCTLPVYAFIRRFLQHVLPKGFVKVRYYGLLRVGNRHLLTAARAALTPVSAVPLDTLKSGPWDVPAGGAAMRCPSCGDAMHLVQVHPRQRQGRQLVIYPELPPSRGPPCGWERRPGDGRVTAGARGAAGASCAQHVQVWAHSGSPCVVLQQFPSSADESRATQAVSSR